MAGEELKILLKPHIGVMNSPLGPVNVEHDQWLVVVEYGGMKQHVGYLTKKEHAPLRWIPYRGEAVSSYGRQMVEQIEAACAAERDKALGVVANAPAAQTADTDAQEG